MDLLPLDDPATLEGNVHCTMAVLGKFGDGALLLICTGAMVALILGDELAITGKIGVRSFCLDFFLAFFSCRRQFIGLVHC